MTYTVFPLALDKLERATLDEIFDRHDRVIAQLEDEPDRAMLAELDQLQAEIDKRSKRTSKARRKS